MSRFLLASLAAAVCCLGLAACGAPQTVIPNEPGQGGDPINVIDPSKYPAGPHGFVSGEVIPNLAFVGREDKNGNGDLLDDPAKTFRFSDYYNNKNVKVLAVLVAAEWCAPCIAEQYELADSYKKYKAEGAPVEYLEVLIESSKKAANGSFLPADLETLGRWASKAYKDRSGTKTAKINFPLGIDPTVELGPFYITPAFPMQLLIRTSDMTIQWQNNGYAPGALESNIASLLE